MNIIPENINDNDDQIDDDFEEKLAQKSKDLQICKMESLRSEKIVNAFFVDQPEYLSLKKSNTVTKKNGQFEDKLRTFSLIEAQMKMKE